MALFARASLLLGLLGLSIVPFRDHVLARLLSLAMPRSWVDSLRLSYTAIFEQVSGTLVFQIAAVSCFSGISVFFFRQKERICRDVEHHVGRTGGGASWLVEACLELELLVLGFNIYSLVFLLGYFFGEPLKSVLSTGAFSVLALLLALDFLSPSFFRRGLDITHVLTHVIRRPAPVMALALLLCTPIWLLEKVLSEIVYSTQDKLVLAACVIVIVVVNAGVVVVGLPAGALLAAPPAGRAPTPTGWGFRSLFRTTQAVLAAALIVFYGAVVAVVATKVPISTATFDIHWSSIRIRDLTSQPKIDFELVVHNTHDYLALEVEQASLLLNYDGSYLAEGSLVVPSIPPRTSRSVPVHATVHANSSYLVRLAATNLGAMVFGESLNWRDKLKARLTVQLPLDFQLPVYIPEGHRVSFAERPLPKDSPTQPHDVTTKD